MASPKPLSTIVFCYILFRFIIIRCGKVALTLLKSEPKLVGIHRVFIIIQVKIFLIVTVIFYLTHYLFRSIILNFKYRNSQDFNVLFEIIVTDVA